MMQSKTYSKSNQRNGYTLIELLVTLALVLFMMAILSEAFVTGLQAFREMKAVADMDQELRTTVTILRNDLQADHFGGQLRLSNRTRVPEQGFFNYEEGAAAINEGVDPNVPNSYSFRDVDDTIHFTVRLPSNRRDEFFYARVPPGSPLDGAGAIPSRYDTTAGNGLYSSQWAEVVYFLVDTGRTTGAPGMKLYNLHRRQRLLVPEFFTNGTIMSPRPTSTINHSNFDISTIQRGAVWWFNSPADIQFPQNRLPRIAVRDSDGIQRMIYPILTGTRRGSDLVLTDVLSFDVKVWDPAINEFRDLGRPYPGKQGGQFANGGTSFDTRSARHGQYNEANIRFPYRDRQIRALKITIRVWDQVSRQTRQITIIQDM